MKSQRLKTVLIDKQLNEHIIYLSVYFFGSNMLLSDMAGTGVRGNISFQLEIFMQVQCLVWW